MAHPGFYNDNEFRAYPFIRPSPDLSSAGSSLPSAGSSYVPESAIRLPDSAIVDFGAIMDVDAAFSGVAGHIIYLYSISRDGDTFVFEFRTTAPRGGEQAAVFVCELSDPIHRTIWTESTWIGAPTTTVFDCDDPPPRWQAFMVAGRLVKELANELASGSQWIYPEGYWQVEPARIQNLADAYLRTLSVANLQRTRATSPAGCDEIVYVTNASHYIDAICMDGPIALRPGYNCEIRQDRRENALVLSANIGAGEGLPCEEIPLSGSEEPPDGSRFLTGGPSCGELVKTINGIGGRNVNLLAGVGFEIDAHQTLGSTLVITYSKEGMALCPEVSSNSGSDS